MKKKPRRKTTPNFVYRYKWEQVFLRISVRADNYQRARRKFKEMRHSLARLRGNASVTIGRYGRLEVISVINSKGFIKEIELELECPHCGVPQYRKESEKCWKLCDACRHWFAMYLNDDCLRCGFQLDCLVSPPGIIT